MLERKIANEGDSFSSNFRAITLSLKSLDNFLLILRFDPLDRMFRIVDRIVFASQISTDLILSSRSLVISSTFRSWREEGRGDDFRDVCSEIGRHKGLLLFDGRSENKRRGIKAKVDCGVPINLFKLANALSNSNLNQSARKKIRDLYPIERRLSLFDVTSLFSPSSLSLPRPNTFTGERKAT